MKPPAIFHAYIITCLATNKRYIGITGDSVEKRWRRHLRDARYRVESSVLWAAIRKHGSQAFQVESLCCAQSWNDICVTERLLVAQWDTFVPRGYNLTLGGEGLYGYKHSIDSVERSASKHRGKPCHPNTIAAAILTHRGKPKTIEHRMKIAASKIGTKRSEATRRKLSEWRKGKSFNVGELNGGAKLAAEQVIDIRAALASGHTQRSQARKYGVSFTAIWRIANGLRWRNIQ